MASWPNPYQRTTPLHYHKQCSTGFYRYGKIGSLANSINQKTGKSIDEIHDGWMGQVPIQRLVDPLETASAITFLALPASGAILCSLAVDGGRLRDLEFIDKVKPNRIVI